MKWRNIVLIMLSCLTIGTVSAQQLKPTFEQTKEEIETANTNRLKRVADYLTATGLKGSYDLGSGRVAYMVDVVNNKPIYAAVDNLAAAQNTGVDDIRAGGSLGLNLTGSGLRLLVWDGPAGTLNSHQEFGDRLRHGSDIPNGSRDNHASHVTGTIIASGVDRTAMGMAPEANAVAYGFTNFLPEMATELSENPESAILSNNSYGALAGWTENDGDWNWNGDEDISTLEDWKFGFYNSQARTFDQLSYDSPFYTIVKSAGNHRVDVGDGSGFPADGPYDILALYTVAKNIVVVGATRKLNGPYTGPEDVNISSFSSFGPTDDGRIKPDISAPGVSVRSAWASSDDSYASIQGTSMATPVVTGGLALIQELHREIAGGFMKSAALKALMIHTANEAGAADGPDYEFGWGLFNAEGMAQMLLEENGDNRQVLMAELADGETDTYTITPDADTKVKVTLVWTDVPGVPVSVQLDPEDLMLVNDLDMRAIGNTDTQEPWIMTPEIPTREASKGDNFRDNVEKIEFVAVDGTYTITINHKNTITEGPQEYALVIEYEKADAGKTLYWVGNTGDWSNGENWSLSSGGRAADVVPTSADQVIFDDNSFAGLGEGETFTITLQADANVGNLKWFAETEGDFAFGGNQISVGGDLIVLGSGVAFGAGDIVIEGQAPGILNVGSAFMGADIVVDGDYEVLNALNVNSLNVQSGTLTINGNNMTVGTMALNGGSLSAANTQINVTGSFSMADGHTIANWTNSEIIVPVSAEDVSLDFGSGETPFNLNIQGTAVISGGENINKLTIANTLDLSTSFSTDSLLMAAATTLNLADASTLTVPDMFDVSGTDGSPVQLSSAGTATLELTNHRKICVDFLNIQGVNYTGDATLSIGTNSVLGGDETGWVQVECDNVLFADFGFEFGCANSVTQFNNTSSGQITGQEWNFGVSGDGEVDSDLENPTNVYNTAGVYDIKLTVADASSNFPLTRVSQIIENTIDAFVVNEPVDGVLVSEVSAQSYQWYLNGSAIPGIGATNRQLQVTQAGIYTVQVSDGTCNRLSTEFTFQVTSIEVDPEEQEQVEEAVNVFPNPTRDHIDVTIEGYTLKTVAMELVDQSGKVVTTSNHGDINSQSFSERLNVSAMRQGFYILRFVVNENIIVNRKVILTE